MATIEINIEELDAGIRKLNSLQKKIEGNCLKPPMKRGEGNTIDELESIANLFQEVDKSFETLVINTVLYMNKVKKEFVQSDETASKKIEGK